MKKTNLIRMNKHVREKMEPAVKAGPTSSSPIFLAVTGLKVHQDL